MKQYDQENCYRSKSRNIWSESSVPRRGTRFVS